MKKQQDIVRVDFILMQRSSYSHVILLFKLYKHTPPLTHFKMHIWNHSSLSKQALENLPVGQTLTVHV